MYVKHFNFFERRSPYQIEFDSILSLTSSFEITGSSMERNRNGGNRVQIDEN